VSAAHTCNPSYPGGRDQEDQKDQEASPGQIVPQDPILGGKGENLSQKRTGGVAQGVVKTPVQQKKKKKKKVDFHNL
jgi:hypothetical protein